MDGHGERHDEKTFDQLNYCGSIRSLLLSSAEPGRWDGRAEFGTFEFTVGSNGSQFESITYHFKDLVCNSVEILGDYHTIFDPPWRITGSSFGFTIELEPGVSIRLSGIFASSTWAAGDWKAKVEGVTCQGNWNAAYNTSSRTVDHAFIKGVYWGQEELPGWGFFADVQEETFFCAVYGYLDQDSSFITLQGSLISSFPMRFQGDVFFRSEGGTVSSDVGDFTWAVGDSEAAPMATLTLTSNILDVTDLKLIRFSYAEDDRVDMITGGNWNIIRRSSDSTFGDLYNISDERTVDDEITYATVTDLGDESKQGRVGYFSDADGDFYGMRIDFGVTTEVFYLFLATNADMYGRYWILESGDQPSGNGDHFRAAADTMQLPGPDSSANTEMLQSLSTPDSMPIDSGRMDIKVLEMQQYQDSGGQLEPMFEDSRVQYAFQKLSRMTSTPSR
jgi:hypothetical protein